MSRYTVRYERDESGWWVAQVKEVPAAITQGRTIVEARRRIREALALALDDDRQAERAKLWRLTKLRHLRRKFRQPIDRRQRQDRAQCERRRALRVVAA